MINIGNAAKVSVGASLPMAFRIRSVVSGAVLAIVFALRSFLRVLHDRLAPPELVVTEHLTGFWRSAALMSAAELRIADRIGNKPIGIDDLANAAQCPTDALLRLLRPLASLGFFAEDARGRWSNTAMSYALRHGSGSGPTLGAAAEFQFKVQWQHWQRLAGALRQGLAASALDTGSASVQSTPQHTATLFDWLGSRPEEQALFHRAMESVTSLAVPALRVALPWDHFPSVMDLGGGSGQFLSAMGTHPPSATRMVLDQEHARPEKMPPGVGFVAGDFFDLEGKLSCYDLIVLKHILHDWNDADCLKILRQIHSNMDPHACVAIIETTRVKGGGDLIAAFADLEMLQSFQSRERSLEEFGSLLASSGFKLVRTVSTMSPFRILLAVRHGAGSGA
jgi:hypothetical protein